MNTDTIDDPANTRVPAAVKAVIADIADPADDMEDETDEAMTAGANMDLPFIKDAEADWSSAHDDAAVRKWAGVDVADPSPEAWKKYGENFFWSAPDAKAFDDFKLPFTTIEDDEPKAVPSGVIAAAGAVQGARAPLDVPEGDVAGIKSKIKSYYSKMDRTVPWEDKPAAMQAAAGWMGQDVLVAGMAAGGVVTGFDGEGWMRVDLGDGGQVICHADDLRRADAPEALTAASIALPDAPPDEWYSNPKLAGPTPLTVTDDGRVFGHIADWKNCHVGYEGVCMAPPHSATGYAYYLLGETRLASGKRVPTGKITLGAGHADGRGGMKAAIDHYDNTATAVATVTVGEDEHGIWAAGALMPGVTGKQVVDLMSSPPSGDWRRIGGNMEMVGAHAVNNPGFPIPRARAVTASGEQVSLVAAGALQPEPASPQTVIDMAARALEEVLITFTQRRERVLLASQRMRELEERVVAAETVPSECACKH